MEHLQDEKNEQLDKTTDDLTSDNTSEGVTDQAPKSLKPSKKILLLVCAIAVIAICLIVGWKLQTNQTPKKTDIPNLAAEKSINSIGKLGSVFCTKVGLDSLQCENLDTKELKKYTLPTSIGNIGYMLPSPDSQKFYISGWSQTSTGGTEPMLAVLNNKLELIATLPVKKDKDGQSDIYDYSVKWLDNNTLIYIKENGDSSTRNTAIFSFDITVKTEKSIALLDVNLERIFPVPGKNYIYGLEAYDVPSENATKRKYIELDLSTKKILDIDQSGVTDDDLSYNPITSQFYANILNQAAQTFDIKVYKVSDPTSAPKFIETQHITNNYAAGTVAYETVVSDKGLFVSHDILEMSAPLRFIDDKNVVTDTNLAVGYTGGRILLSLPNFPDFPKAENNDIVVSDFFRPKEGTPTKIVSFLNRKVMNDPNCKKGEYSTFDNVTYDSDKQFSVLVSSCKTSALVFYVANGDSYKQIAATQEGMSCEQRNKLGISAKVFPDCRLPGEGL